MDRESWAKVLFAAVCTTITYLLGGWDQALKALVIFMALDYLTGLASAYIGQRISSKIGFSGIVKKVAMLALVIVAHQLDLLTGAKGISRTAVIYFLVANDGISILENLGECGIPIPEFIRRALDMLKKKEAGE